MVAKPLYLPVTFLALLLGLGLCSCGKKVSKEAAGLLATTALAAKERAITFAAVAPQLHAKAKPEEPGVQRFAGAHAQRLAAQAKALADFNEALSKDELDKSTIRQIGSLAESAKASAENFRALTPKVDWKWPEFSETHQAALDLQAQQLAQLYEAVKPKEKPAP